MNDEVKEILDRLNNIPMGELYACCLEDSECKLLLDYITNLQEELEEQKRIEQASLDTINNLQEENERLKKENIKLYKKDTKIINELKEELEITQEKWNKDKQWSEYRTKEWLDYKSRCEKAIEYIMSALITEWDIKNDGYVSGSDLPVDSITPIIDILNGD